MKGRTTSTGVKYLGTFYIFALTSISFKDFSSLKDMIGIFRYTYTLLRHSDAYAFVWLCSSIRSVQFAVDADCVLL